MRDKWKRPSALDDFKLWAEDSPKKIDWKLTSLDDGLPERIFDLWEVITSLRIGGYYDGKRYIIKVRIKRL